MMMKDRIRLLQVLEATTAGVKHHVGSLVTRLDPQRFDVSVACPWMRENAYGDTGFVQDLTDAGIPVHVVPMRRRIAPLSDLRALFQLQALIRQGAYHIVHTHSAKAGILGRLAAYYAGTGARIVHTPHAFAFQSTTNPVTRWLYLGLEQLVSRWTDCLICVSESEAAIARSVHLTAEDRLVVIPNGIDLQPFQRPVNGRAVRRSLGLEPQAPTVGTVGRLSRQKGLSYLIRAIASVVSRMSSVQLMIVGDGELRGELENLARKLGVEKRCHFLGFRSNVPEIMAAFDVFVLPSLYEGLPYTVLEAMAARRPVVATDVVGSRDVIMPGRTGILVPPKDSLALARAVMVLLSDPGKARGMVQRARDHVERYFTLDRMVSENCNLYEQLLVRRMAIPLQKVVT